MDAEDQVGAVQLSARLCGVSPPVTRRILITEQASLAQLHAALQAAFAGRMTRFGYLLESARRAYWRNGFEREAREFAVRNLARCPSAARPRSRCRHHTA